MFRHDSPEHPCGTPPSAGYCRNPALRLKSNPMTAAEPFESNDPAERIRPAREEDTPAIHALIGAIIESYGDRFDVRREDTHLQAPGPYFRNTGGEFWVVEREGEVIASCAIALHADSAELKSLYVRRERRGRGLGRRLVDIAMDYARRAGRRRMTLWSDTRFVEAHRLYERLGFVRGGRRELTLVNTFSEFYYERELTDEPPGASA